MTRTLTAIGLTTTVALIIAGTAATLHAQQQQPATPAPATAPAAGAADDAEGERWTTASGLTIVRRHASGQEGAAAKGDTVWVHYIGRLQNGPLFDTSFEHGSPVDFELGSNVVIPGWEEGIAGMRIGEVRRLIIPPQLGYGAQGMAPAIPPNATLIFDVELVGIRKGTHTLEPPEEQIGG